MNTLHFTSLNMRRLSAQNKEHFRILTKLNLDKKVQNYLPEKIKVKPKCLESDDIYCSQFIVYDGEVPIGYLETSPLMARNIFAFNYAVLPECRGLGYGKKIVDETSNYVLDREVSSVLLCISPKNKYSIASAVHSGFTVLNQREYTYVKRKQNFLLKGQSMGL